MRYWILIVMMTLGGCSSAPVLPYEASRPAQVLMPLQPAGVTDGRARFREIFCERLEAHGGFEEPCEFYLHHLDDEPLPLPGPSGRFGGDPGLPADWLRVYIVPGYLGDSAPNDMMPFGPPVAHLNEQGYRIEYITVSGNGSSDYNAVQIADFLRDVEIADDEKLVLIGYSKGTTDILHFLVNHPEEAARVGGVISFAGAVNGSPLADILPEILVSMIASGSKDVGDEQGLSSIKRSVQMRWMAAHPLPRGPEYYSVCAFTNSSNISTVLREAYKKLSTVDPRNDSQVIFYDQVIPGSTLLGYANGDHWALALPFTEEAETFAKTLMDRNWYPRLALFEAVLLYVRETI